MMSAVRENERTVCMSCRRRAVPRDRERADAFAVLFLIPVFFEDLLFQEGLFFAEKTRARSRRDGNGESESFFLTLKNA